MRIIIWAFPQQRTGLSAQSFASLRLQKDTASIPNAILFSKEDFVL
jgi:hypothetical protein